MTAMLAAPPLPLTDEQRIDAGCIEHVRKRRVIAGQHRDFLAARMHLA